jgi:hypothetical protein
LTQISLLLLFLYTTTTTTSAAAATTATKSAVVEMIIIITQLLGALSLFHESESKFHKSAKQSILKPPSKLCQVLGTKTKKSELYS